MRLPVINRLLTLYQFTGIYFIHGFYKSNKFSILMYHLCLILNPYFMRGFLYEWFSKLWSSFSF